MRELAEELAIEWPRVETWGIAGIMLDEMRRFRHSKLQSYRATGVQINTPFKHRVLFEIFSLGNVPNNRNTIYAILQDVHESVEEFDIEDHVDEIEDELDRSGNGAA